jgi:hypothetical protein
VGLAQMNYRSAGAYRSAASIFQVYLRFVSRDIGRMFVSLRSELVLTPFTLLEQVVGGGHQIVAVTFGAPHV